MKMDNEDVLDKAEQLRTRGKSFALVTVVRVISPASVRPGAKAIVESDGIIQGWVGGGCVQPAVIKTSKKVLDDGQAQLIRVRPTKDGVAEEGIVDFGMTCHSGGTLDIFIEPIVQKPVLLIIGTSPVAQALTGLAKQVGFSVTVAFPDIDPSMFPDADVLVDGFAVENLTANYVLVSTQGKRDEQGLEAAMSVNSNFIGFVASKKKGDKLKDYLKESGNETGKVDSIISPIGVEISALTPQEIALSILAALVEARRTPSSANVSKANANASKSSERSCCGSSKETKPTAKKTDSNETVSVSHDPKNKEKSDPICGMSVTVDGAEFTSRHLAETYYFCCGGCLHRFEREPEKYLV